MMHDYSDGCFWGGEAIEGRITREIWREGTLYLIGNVPAGVCGPCGERYLTPDVARRVDDLPASKGVRDHMAEVPAYDYCEPSG